MEETYFTIVKNNNLNLNKKQVKSFFTFFNKEEFKNLLRIKKKKFPSKCSKK